MIFKQTITTLIVLLLFNQPAFAERVDSVKAAQEYLSKNISDILKKKVENGAIESDASIGIRGILYDGKHTPLSEEIEYALGERFINDSSFKVYDRSSDLMGTLEKEIKEQNTNFNYDQFNAIPAGHFSAIDILITGKITVSDDISVVVTALTVKKAGKIATVRVEIKESAADNYLVPSDGGEKIPESPATQQEQARDEFMRGKHYYNEEYYSKALEHFEKACNGKYGEGCYEFGNMYNRGRYVTENESKAEEYYRKAVRHYETDCDEGNADECSKLGDMYYKGKGIDENEPKAMELYKKGCEGSSAYGCYQLGDMYYDGNDSTPANKEYAKRYYQKSCQLSYNEGCESVGSMEEGQRKFKLAKRSCNSGNAEECYELARMYSAGNAITENYPEAVKYYKQSCDGGYTEGCYRLGRIYRKGKSGVTRNYPTAVEYFKQSCDGGYVEGCYRLGGMYKYGRDSRGRGVNKNIRYALHYYDRACAGGLSRGCKRAAKIRNNN